MIVFFFGKKNPPFQFISIVCANTGRILYRCEEYNQGRQIVLQNCQKYTNPLNLQSSLEPNAVPQVFCGAYMTHYPNGGVAYTGKMKSIWFFSQKKEEKKEGHEHLNQ